MDHYADDLAALVEHLDLHDAVHVGHSTGGGEVVHYIARHGEDRVAKAVLISAVPPLMVQTEANPGGLPKSVFDDLQAQLAANRSEFYRALPSGPFYGFNRPGVEPSEAIIENWWRQGMMGGAKAHYDGIVAFSQTDFTEDLKKITVPVLVMHGDDDQIVPYADSGAAVRGAPAERHAEDLRGLPARHADHPGRDDQRRPAGVHPVLTGADTAAEGRFGLRNPGRPSPTTSDQYSGPRWSGTARPSMASISAQSTASRARPATTRVARWFCRSVSRELASWAAAKRLPGPVVEGFPVQVMSVTPVLPRQTR